MKRITVVLLMTVYLLSILGVSASSFYCCGVLKSTTYSIGEIQGSDNVKTVKGNNCCKTTKQSFKVKDNHFGAASFTCAAKIFPAICGAVISFQFDTKPYTKVYTAFNSHAPPFRQHEPIYILNCTYRI